MADPKHGPFDDHWFAIACLSQDADGVELDVACIEHWDRARRLVGDMVPGIVVPEWWQPHDTDLQRPLRHAVFRHTGGNAALGEKVTKHVVVVARIRGAQDITDWLPAVTPLPGDGTVAPDFEDAASLKQLAHTIAYGGRLDNAFRGTTRVVLIAKTIHELRTAINDRDHTIKALRAEAKLTAEDEASRGCTMMARIDCGHGQKGYCTIMDKACPRECLLKQIDAHRMNTEARDRSIEDLRKILEERDALIKLCLDGKMLDSNGEPLVVDQAYGRLVRSAVTGYLNELLAEAYKLDADADDSNHEALDAAGHARDGIETFVRWVLTGKKPGDE